MSIQDNVIDKGTLNSAFVSKRATGTQIMAGSLRIMGTTTIDGKVVLGEVSSGALNASSIVSGGAVSASVFSGSGASLTNLPAGNLVGSIADARLSSNVFLLDKVQTLSANVHLNSSAGMYFAGGTVYKIQADGSATFNNLSVTNNININGDKLLIFSAAGVGLPTDNSPGAKIKLYGSSYQFGMESSGIWYDTHTLHKFYTNEGTATRTERLQINPSGIAVSGDATITNNLEVQGEFKGSGANVFPDPFLMNETGLWAVPQRGSFSFDITQKPAIEGVAGSLKVTSTADDCYTYYGSYFEVDPGSWVTFSTYLKATTTGKRGQLYIEWSNASKQSILNSEQTINSMPTSFSRFSITAQAPSTAAYFRVRIDNDMSGVVAYFSAFQVEYSRTLTGFQGYLGGKAAAFIDRGLKLGASSEILSAYNNNHILKDHANGNITLSGANGRLYLGYQNTSGLVISTDAYASDNSTKMLGKDGSLYYKGQDLDTRFLLRTGGSMVGNLTIGAYSIVGANPRNFFKMDANTVISSVSNIEIVADSDDSSQVEFLSLKAGIDELKVVSNGDLLYNGGKVWHAGNMGAGSGLNADLIQGKALSDLSLEGHTHERVEYRGRKPIPMIRENYGAGIYTYGAYTDPNAPPGVNYASVLSYGGGAAAGHNEIAMSWHPSSQEMYFRGLRDNTADNWYQWRRVWHDGNFDPSKKANDSVTLTGGTGIVTSIGNLTANRTISFDTAWGDGRYLGKTAQAADSAKLGGLTSGQFLRKDTSDTMSGNLTVTGKVIMNELDASGEITSATNISIRNVPGNHRESNKINFLNRIAGRVLNYNPDFITQSLSGYSTYDNNSSGRVVRSIISDDMTPNANGRIMRISYDPARNTTKAAAPAYGGFYIANTRSVNDLTNWGYTAGNRYIYRIVAKIPTGRSIMWASNATGSGGGGKWISSRAGTDNWEEYTYMLTIGNSGTFSSTSYFYVEYGPDTAFTWDVAICQVIGIDEVPDVDRAPTLNVGYKGAGMELGWGDIYATGRIRNESSIEAGGDISVPKTNSFKSSSGGSYFMPLTASNNMVIKAGEGSKALYVDAENVYFRDTADNTALSIYPRTGAMVLAGNMTVGQDLSVTGEHAKLLMTGGTTNSRPRFVIGEQNVYGVGMEWDSSYSLLIEGFNNTSVTGSPSSIMGTIDIRTGLLNWAGPISIGLGSSNGLIGRNNLPIFTDHNNGNVTVSAAGSNLYLGYLNTGKVLLSTDLYSGDGNTRIIDKNTGALFYKGQDADVRYVTSNGSTMTGQLQILNGANTIGGASMNAGWLLVGTATSGLALDPNEIYFAGTKGNIGTIGNHDLGFATSSTERMTITSTGNIGIGHSTPTYKLQVEGETRFNRNFKFGFFEPDNKQARAGFSSNANNDLIFEVASGTEAMRILGDKKVGINTTTPSENLEVAGTTRISRLGLNTAPHSTYALNVAGDIEVSGWIRSSGITGILFSSYGGGFYMNDANWIRTQAGKGIYSGAGIIRSDGAIHVGPNKELEVTPTIFNWFKGNIYSDVNGKVAINQTSTSEHPLHVKSNGSYQGYNLQRTATTDVSGVSWQNADGNYTMNLATRDAGSGKTHFSFYSGFSKSMSALSEVATIFDSGDFWTKNDITVGHRLMVRGDSGRADSAAIDLAIGDSDTGFKWVSDGKFQLYTNNTAKMTFDTIRIQSHLPILSDSNISTAAGNGNGFRFWDSDTYKIFMSSSEGNLPWVSGADYNMYFKMGTGNRGFAFSNPTQGGINAQIEGNGRVNSRVGFRADKYEMAYNSAEDSLDFIYWG